MIGCYYVNCPTLYVPVRGGRVRRWLNLRKLGGVGFAPCLVCGVEVLGHLSGVAESQLHGRLYRRNRGWLSVAVRRYRSIALVLVMRADSGAIPGDGVPGNSPSGICHNTSLTFSRSDAAS